MSVDVDQPASRPRPRDRKQRIEEAAALAFAQQGYHPVGMQDIATAVGISAPALYRHFPNKYALLERTAFALADRLIEDTEEASELAVESVSDARAALDALIDAVIATTIDRRATGGIYRWEGRYLERADRDRLTARFVLLRERFERPHRVYRPDVPAAERRFVVLAALSVVASITAHHTVIAARTLRVLLRDAAWRVLDAQIATPDAASTGDLVEPTPIGATRREQLIDSAIRLFAARGYNEVTIEDIAVEVDLTPSGIYRHFDSKPAILVAACDRASVALDHTVLDAREASSAPDEALRKLCSGYVEHSFRHVALMRVYVSELGNLAADQQRRLRALQRAHVADWTALLQAVRPELGSKEAAVLVHAGFNVVADELTVLPERDAAAAARLTGLVEAVLGIHQR